MNPNENQPSGGSAGENVITAAYAPLSTPNVGLIGSIKELNAEKDDFDVWYELFELYCDTNQILADKRKSTFLTLIGANVYAAIRALVIPRKPRDCTIEQLVTAVRNYVRPPPSIVAERNKFHSRIQLESENVRQYLLELKKLSVNCEFGNGLAIALRDQFVFGIRDETLKKEIFKDRNPDYTRLMQIMEIWEGTRVSLESEKKVSLAHCSTVHSLKGGGSGGNSF